ncbi:hypothetical protein MPER_07279, partial [Moniliophthora perniciosa FA553]
MSSELELEETVARSLDQRFVVILPLNTVIVTFLVYGIYIAVFSICVPIFRRSKKDPENDQRNKLYIWSTFLLFGLVTISNAIYTWYYFSQALFFYDMVRLRDYERFLEYSAHDDTNVRGTQFATRFDQFDLRYDGGKTNADALTCPTLTSYLRSIG